MQKYITPLITGAFALLTYSAQAQKCGHDLLEAEVDRVYPERAAQWQEFINTLDFDNHSHAAENVFTIPVVVHVIYDGIEDNISEKQIQDAIDVLNEDFRRMNADASNTRPIFQGVAADCEIEFKLAQLDPNGNCTNGITRTESALSVNAGNNVKSLINWDRTSYMNVWVVNSISLSSATQGTVLGYAYKPNPGQSTTFDGIVIRHDRMGRIGSAVSMGRTLTHEVGHYLGLDHPFNGGCFQGDNCADTPPVDEASFGCNLNANTCSNDSPNLPDQIENYMDYADDNCMNMFTEDQRTIMRGSLNNINLRGYLVSAANQNETGMTPGLDLGCAPQAKFEPDQNVLCAGETITFHDKSRFNPTSWTWTFPGGTPSTSTDANPTVTYSTPGNYNVRLVAGNNNGNDTLIEVGEISVRNANSSMWVNGFNSGFEFHDLPNAAWHVENEDRDAVRWVRTDLASYEGDYAAELANFNNQPDNVDALVSDRIFVGGATDLLLSFRYAAATKPGGTGDRIVVSVSDDCGENWQSIRTILGPLLYSATNRTTYWRPTAPNQWKNVNVSLKDYAGGAPIMVKIAVISGGGNNVFLDDISINATLSNEELAEKPLSLYPNPTSGSFTVKGLDAGTAFEITDLQGRTLLRGALPENGRIDWSAPAGYYLFRTASTQLPLIVQ